MSFVSSSDSSTRARPCHSVRNQYEAYRPSPVLVPVGPDQLARIDDGLHYGWSWHRYRFCFRRSQGLRILDAGCGTGLSTLGLARLNPGSKVLGIDASPRAITVAKERAEAAGPVANGVEFRAHDLDSPLPGGWGPFDFVACRRVLSQADDPARILKHLAAALDERGLLYVTLPARSGRQPARQLRQAVEALSGPVASLEERVAVASDLFRTLRPDHPIGGACEAGFSGTALRPPSGSSAVSERGRTRLDSRRGGSVARRGGPPGVVCGHTPRWRPEEVLVADTATEQLKSRADALLRHASPS